MPKDDIDFAPFYESPLIYMVCCSHAKYVTSIFRGFSNATLSCARGETMGSNYHEARERREPFPLVFQGKASS